MASDKVKEYIDNARKAGYSDSQIRETLQKAGWQEKDINDALGTGVSVPLPPSPPPSTPSQQIDLTQHSQTTDNHNNKRTNVLAIIAFICAFLVPLIGLILGVIALSEIKKSGEKGKGLATAAIIIPLVLLVLFLVIWGIAFSAYFGVLDPARMLPERCQFPAGMDCIDKPMVTSSETTIALRNNIGFQIRVNNVESTKCSGAQIAVGQNNDNEFKNLNNTLVNNNEVFLVKLTGCNNGNAGQKVEETIKVHYENTESGLPNTATGDVRGRAI